MSKNGLGGLEWLNEGNTKKQTNVIDGKKVREVLISTIEPDPKQPRKEIDESNEQMKQLAHSIKQRGFINFITVREIENKKYVIVAGERRFTAAKIAGLKKIPVFVIDENKEPLDYALMQLEENIHREDLNPFDEALAYIKISEEFGLSQMEVANEVKKDKRYISKMLKLEKIPEELRKKIISSPQKIARQVLWDLAAYPDSEQEIIWNKIEHNPSIKSLEKAAKQLQKKREEKAQGDLDSEMIWKSLKKAVQKDRNLLLKYISKNKAQKLMQEFPV